MRGTTAAFRALRAARASQWSLSRTNVTANVVARALCSSAPTTHTKGDTDGSVAASIDPVMTAVASDVNSMIEEENAPVEMASEATESPQSDTGMVVDVSELNGDGEELVSSNESVGDEQYSDSMHQYETADDLALVLEKLLEHSSLKPMLIFRAALEQQGAPLVNERIINLMLPVMARHSWFRTIKDTLDVVEEKNIVLDTLMYNCALFALTRIGELNRMKDILARMNGLKKKSRPNSTTYNLLIAAHFYQGTVDDAFNVLSDMKEANVYPTIATYATLVSGCLRRRDHERAFKTVLAIEQQGMSASAMTLAQVLYSAATEDQYGDIVHLMNNIGDIMPLYSKNIARIAQRRRDLWKNTPHVEVDERGYPRLELSLLNAVMHSALRGLRPDIAVLAWDLHREYYPELPHTADHWYSLIGTLAGAGDLHGAFDAIGHMRAVGIEPSIRDLTTMLIQPLSTDVEKIDEIYYYLVERLEDKDLEADDVADATETPIVADETPEIIAESHQTTPDDTTINAAPSIDEHINTETAADLVESADETVGDGPMQSPSEHVSLSEAIGLGPSGGDGNMGEYTLPWHGKRRAEVGITEFNCVIAACAIAGDLDRAFQTYDEACGRLGLERNADTLNALLEGCVTTRHVRGGRRVLDEARSQGTLFEPNTIHFATRLHCRAGRGEDALALIREAVDHGALVPFRTFHMVARFLQRTGAVDQASECAELATNAGFRESVIMPRHFRRAAVEDAVKEDGIDFELENVVSDGDADVSATDDEIGTQKLDS